MGKGDYPGKWSLPDIIALSYYFSLNSINIRGIVEKYESLSEYIYDSKLHTIKLFEESIESTIDKALSFAHDFELKHKSNNIEIVSFYSVNYPFDLKHIYYPPIIIFIQGTLHSALSLSIIGTRKPTQYGVEIASIYARSFAEAGIITISGLANGIDSHVHKEVLRNKGITYAVIASGIDSITPAISKELTKTIVENDGAIISEHQNGIKALPPYFPQRNRIISGLSKGVIVIESGIKGGSMITAQFAFEQNRDLYAVPGFLTSEMSKGTNLLIQQQKASITLKPEDILTVYGLKSHKRSGESNYLENELPILQILEHIPVHINELACKTNMLVKDIIPLIVSLEFKGAITQLPGGFIIKKYHEYNI